jgi:hypothetical protein
MISTSTSPPMKDESLAARTWWSVRNALVLARRGVTRIIREPSQLLDVTVQPVIFILRFVYVFGSALPPPVRQPQPIRAHSGLADATPRTGHDPLVDWADRRVRPSPSTSTDARPCGRVAPSRRCRSSFRIPSPGQATFLSAPRLPGSCDPLPRMTPPNREWTWVGASVYRERATVDPTRRLLRG